MPNATECPTTGARHGGKYGLAAVALTCLICVAWQLTTPMTGDDFVYLHIAPPSDDPDYYWQMTGERITSAGQLPEAVAAHARYVNGRLANLLYTIVQLLPRWVIGLVNGVGICVFFLVLLRYIRPRAWEDDRLTALMTVMFWTCLQWNDQMGSADFQFNYTWSSAMMLGVMTVFDRSSRPGWGGWTLLAVMGLWHEGFAIATGVYLGVKWLFRPRDIRLLAAVGILVIEVLLALLTGTGTRAGAVLGGGFNFNLMLFASTGWPFGLAVVFWLVRRYRLCEKARRDLDRTAVAVVMACLASFAVTQITLSAPRSHWPAELLSIALVGRTLITYKPVRFARWLRIALSVVYVAWGVSLVYWQIRVREFTDIIDMSLTPSNAVVATDKAVYRSDIPFWLMGIVNEPVGPSRVDFMWTRAYHVADRAYITFAVVPAAYRGVPFDRWPRIPGDNNLRGFYGNYIRRADGTDMKGRMLRVHLASGPLYVSPLNLAAGWLGRGILTDGTVDVRVVFAGRFPYQGDSLEVLTFYLPVSLASRRITAIDEL